MVPGSGTFGPSRERCDSPMLTGMTVTSPLEVLEPWQCWDLLQTGRVGRIAFTDRALPAIRPLNYVTVGNRIMLRVAGDDLGRRLDGQVVAFEVDDVDVD